MSKKNISTVPEGVAQDVATLLALGRLLDRELCSLAILPVFRSNMTFTECPSCGAALGKRPISAVAHGRQGRCSKCKTSFNRWTGTPLQGARIKPEKIISIGACRQLEIPYRLAADVVGISPTTVMKWYKHGENLGIWSIVFGKKAE